MTRVFCEFDTCDYNADGACMKGEISLVWNESDEMDCADYEETLDNDE